MGAIGVTGTAAANALAAEADLILAIGTRLQDFTTGSWALFGDCRQIDHRPEHRSPSTPASIAPCRWSRMPREGLAELAAALAGYRAPAELDGQCAERRKAWHGGLRPR